MDQKEITYADSPSPDVIKLRSKEMDLESGWLGQVFGGARTAPSNIAGLCVLLLIFAGIALVFLTGAGMSAPDYWKIAAPIITLILGFLFGKSG